MVCLKWSSPITPTQVKLCKLRENDLNVTLFLGTFSEELTQTAETGSYTQNEESDTDVEDPESSEITVTEKEQELSEATPPEPPK